MKNLFYVSLLSVGLMAQGQTVPGTRPSAAPQSVRPVDRIHSRIDEGRRVRLAKNRHPLAVPQYDRGLVPPDLRMDHMILALAADPSQQATLDALVRSQQDPASPLFHQWLTPKEFGASFGISDGDLDRLVQWLHGYGFQTDPVAPGRRSIAFRGTASQVQLAFHTQIHAYEVDGRRHYANASDPEIPEALAAVVAGVGPLDDFAPSRQSHKRGIAPLFTAPDGVTHALAPADLAAIYNVNPLYDHGVDGRKESIAIVGRTNIDLSNVRKFRNVFGLPPNDPTVTVNGDDPGIVSDDEAEEAYLDVEWAGAMAPNANIQFVVTASGIGVILSADYVVQNNLAPVMSMSFGLCEQASDSVNKFMSALWQQAAAQGITVLVSSGDSGAAGCDKAGADHASSDPAVNALCSSPNSTCVGGTEFNEGKSPSQYWSVGSSPYSRGSVWGYIPEVAWNESGASGGKGLWASGGGVSAVYPAPDFQTKYFGSLAGRVVPDVALTAAGHDGYLVCAKGGNFQMISGTSAAAPSFAGIAALLVQYQGGRVGNLNYELYLLGVVQYYGGPAIFHDVVAGDNNVPGITTYYQAGPWYDPVTGWGSVDATALVVNWGQWHL